MANPILSAIRLGLRVLPRPLRERWAVRLTVRSFRYAEPERERVFRERGEAVVMAGMAGTAFGSGPLVVLLHGWAGRGLQLAAYIEPLVAAGYRVVALDGPGCGRSPGKRTGLPFWVPALDQLIREHGPVAFVTHSFGGLATLLASQWNGYAGCILCIAGPPEMKWAVMEGRRSLGLNEEDLEYYFALAGKFLDADIDLYRTETLTDVKARVHALLAAEDEEFPEAMPRAIVESVGGTVEVLPGLGHKNIMWDPAAVAKGVAFVATGRVDAGAHPA